MRFQNNKIERSNVPRNWSICIFQNQWTIKQICPLKQDLCLRLSNKQIVFQHATWFLSDNPSKFLKNKCKWQLCSELYLIIYLVRHPIPQRFVFHVCTSFKDSVAYSCSFWRQKGCLCSHNNFENGFTTNATLLKLKI